MKKQRILIVCFDNVGDLVFVSCVSRALKAQFPEATIDLWCKEYTSQIAHLMPGISKVYHCDPFWDKSPLRPKGRIWPFLKEFWKIRQRNYDLAVVTASCYRAAAFTFLAGITQRIGYDRPKSRLFLTDTVEKPDPDKPVVAELMRLLGPLCVDHRQSFYSLLPPRSCSIDRDRKYVALHPFAGNRKRCAPLSLWQNFADYLKSQKKQIIWLGSESELLEVRSLGIYEETEFLDHYIPQPGLGAMTQYIAGSSLFVGHDSGPLHIAGGLGRQVIGLYLPSEYKRTFPQSENPGVYLVKSSPKELGLDDLIAAAKPLLSQV